MARKLIIPIDDHNDGNTCSLYYTVKYKLSSVSNWTYLSEQQPIEIASPLSYYLEINNLEDDVNYDYEIIRHCCNDQGTPTTSAAASGTILTTP